MKEDMGQPVMNSAMIRYKIIHPDTGVVEDRIKNKALALDKLQSLNDVFNGSPTFLLKVDWWASVLYGLLGFFQMFYLPVYITGILLLMVARVILALAYAMLLQPKTAWNILKFITRWKGQE